MPITCYFVLIILFLTPLISFRTLSAREIPQLENGHVFASFNPPPYSTFLVHHATHLNSEPLNTITNNPRPFPITMNSASSGLLVTSLARLLPAPEVTRRRSPRRQSPPSRQVQSRIGLKGLDRCMIKKSKIKSRQVQQISSTPHLGALYIPKLSVTRLHPRLRKTTHWLKPQCREENSHRKA
jgi:hypothetical protein